MDPAICFLDGYVDSAHSTWRTAVRQLPFAIGRRPDADMVLSSTNVSGRHAELRRRGDQLLICDLDSTNGSFVNGQPVSGCAAVASGDYLHFGDQEFVLVIPESSTWTGLTAALPPTARLGTAALPPSVFEAERILRDLLKTRSVTSYFQAIVDLHSGRTVAYEVLGRGIVNGEIVGPGELFRTAEACGLEIELVELFREDGFAAARSLPPDSLLYFNTHPAELVSPVAFLNHLRGLRSGFTGGPQLILEIHEQAVTSTESLHSLRSGLNALDIGLAFDDFGTGQARLRELVEVEPRVVKFDIAWIRGLDTASPKRREMIAKLVQLIGDMGVASLAEGVERPEEAESCQALGFELAQGYLFGHPLPASELV